VTIYQEKIKSILIIRMSAIGDIILSSPVIDSLREYFPEARLDYLIKKEHESLVKYHPGLDNVIAFSKNDGLRGLNKLVRQFRADRYDLIVDLHGTLRSTYIRFVSPGIMNRVYRKNSIERRILRWSEINLMDNAPRVCDRYYTALEDFGIARNGKKPKIYIDENSKSSIRKILDGQKKEPAEKYLAISPGASYQTKRWPSKYFTEAASDIALEKDLKVLLLGGGSDRKISEKIADELSEKGLLGEDLSGRLSLLESAAAISMSELLITNDSGLMHIADATGTPLVAIFGPTSKELGFYPIGEKAVVIEIFGLSCRPCSLHGDKTCPKIHHHCMEQITPKEVYQAAISLLSHD
jgi:lipopolysaccharide heptosyltransferase II